MAIKENVLIKRGRVEKSILSYIEENKKTASFRFLRGRRRIGKSTLLKQIISKSSYKCFYFSGALDEGVESCLSRWVQAWSEFNNETELKNYSKKNLSWIVVFKDLAKFAKQHKKNFAIFIDEIQWIAKTQTGFVSLLKENWLVLEHLSNVKIIICGSSFRFFHEYTGGEEKILRGLCTHRDLWLEDLSLNEVHKHFVPHWSKEEVIMAYMMIGGIPYYWQQVPENKSFIQSMNQVFFNPETIFLSEPDEILKIEFNKAGLKTIKEILSALGPLGANVAKIQEKSRIPLSTIQDAIEKLMDYNVLRVKVNFKDKIKKNKNGLMYEVADTFLYFYFNVLQKFKRKILNNDKMDLIFLELLNSNNTLTIENFSGYAFERLLQQLLRKELDRDEKIFKSLDLANCDYHVGSIQSETAQVDVVLQGCSDRKDRWIECRWTKEVSAISELLSQLQKKVAGDNNQSQENIEKIIITNCNLTKSLQEKARKLQIHFLEIDQLF